MMAMWFLFRAILALHVAVGVVALVTFWVAMLSRKGGAVHRHYGGYFARAVLIGAGAALLLSLLTLADPLQTHPRQTDPIYVVDVFGWMMMFLAIFTLALVWHGRASVRLKADHLAHRRVLPVMLQLATLATALNCLWRGFAIHMPLMMIMPVVGILFVIGTLRFIANPSPPRGAYLMEHVQGIVGGGIAVYTASLNFGAVQIFPTLSLNPLLWAAPVLVGSCIITWHVRRLRMRGAGV